MKRLGLLALGIGVGLVLTEYLIMKEKQSHESEEPVRRDGLFAELDGTKVRMYRVQKGRFMGYEEQREFATREEAFDWITKETNAKIVIVG